MRSHWPVIPAIKLLWIIMTPLGRPVEPLVYMTTARSDGCGFTSSFPAAKHNRKIIVIIVYSNYCLFLLISDSALGSYHTM